MGEALGQEPCGDGPGQTLGWECPQEPPPATFMVEGDPVTHPAPQNPISWSKKGMVGEAPGTGERTGGEKSRGGHTPLFGPVLDPGTEP